MTVRFLESSGHLHFEAVHTSWTASIDLAPSDEQVSRWQSSLQWDHPHVGFIGAPILTGQDRRDAVLHGARLARGLSLLTEGTTLDLGTGAYLNPSDWRDRNLETFVLEDHVQIEQHERVGEGRMWLHTRGLGKFGLDELETFQSIGLTERECRHRLLETAETIIRQNRNLKIGEQIDIPGEKPCRATAVRHRTDSLYGHPIAFREMTWTLIGV